MQIEPPRLAEKKEQEADSRNDEEILAEEIPPDATITMLRKMITRLVMKLCESKRKIQSLKQDIRDEKEKVERLTRALEAAQQPRLSLRPCNS